MAAESKPKRNTSAMKRAKQNEAKALRNKSQKTMIKTLVKHLEKAVADKNAETAGIAFTRLISAIDKAAQKGIIHRNTAARNVSRFTKLVNKLSLSEAA